LNKEEELQVKNVFMQLASEGFRVLAVAESTFQGNNYPKTQQELPFRLIGLVAFFDPPKENIGNVFRQFYQAGIDVKILTGDNSATTMTIAKQVGFMGQRVVSPGKSLLSYQGQRWIKRCCKTHLMTRMFPDAKLRVIESLKNSRQIVAMTGDGVNDAPALKASHIGIAMGKRGSDVARDAASLILADDDLGKMVDAVAMGRKIYSNLKKAIQYIISIHIPIIFTVFIPLALGWVYPNIFTPVHVIFLELIMGPTCSIIYENEPMEKNLMKQTPRPLTETFFNWKELGISIIQGIMITAGTLISYQLALTDKLDEDGTRTMVFITLITANIFLTLVNRSFYFSILDTIRYKNRLVPLIIGITIILTIALVLLPPFARFFKFQQLAFHHVWIAILIGALSVLWFEGFKAWRRNVDINRHINSLPCEVHIFM
jgi:Ca2+-transporting ATPase